MLTRLRRLLLAVHIGASVAWIGAVLAYLPLDIVAASTADVATLRAAYIGMDIITTWVLVPLALAALATGIWIALATPWGLFRHYWVVLSLILTTLATLVLLVETRTIAHYANIAASGADAEVVALANTLPHSIGGLFVLVVVLVLNVYKPKGLTRYGWRKQREERG